MKQTSIIPKKIVCMSASKHIISVIDTTVLVSYSYATRPWSWLPFISMSIHHLLYLLYVHITETLLAACNIREME